MTRAGGVELVDQPCRLDPVADRHHDVHEDEIGCTSPASSTASSPFGPRHDDEAAVLAEDRLDQLREAIVVLRDQDAKRHLRTGERVRSVLRCGGDRRRPQRPGLRVWRGESRGTSTSRARPRRTSAAGSSRCTCRAPPMAGAAGGAVRAAARRADPARGGAPRRRRARRRARGARRDDRASRRRLRAGPGHGDHAPRGRRPARAGPLRPRALVRPRPALGRDRLVAAERVRARACRSASRARPTPAPGLTEAGRKPRPRLQPARDPASTSRT